MRAHANLRNTTVTIADEASFKYLICLERKRSERTAADFLVVLLNAEPLAEREESGTVEKIGRALGSVIRDTDVTGWYRTNSTLGMIFTALNGSSRLTVQSAISARIQKTLAQNLLPEQIRRLEVSFHFFPKDDKTETTYREAEKVLYPDNENQQFSQKLFAALKRTMDIVGSLVALILLLPLFLVISVGIKMTSPGPVLFRQKRLGKYGAEFTFLKFRSMTTSSDPHIHKQYTERLIRGYTDNLTNIYKIQNDPRVTALGRLLRITSLDELPQFINVLVGDMSLVGPRPPIPYEFECYQPWHRRRVLEAKPGITGVWQVNGRSRTTFDEMVRMDLQYVRNQSLWLDLKILLKTPFVVLSRNGAF